LLLRIFILGLQTFFCLHNKNKKCPKDSDLKINLGFVLLLEGFFSLK